MAARKRPSLPKAPRFSPTKLNAYRFCPRAYGFQYDQGLRWGGTTAGQSFGGSLHRTLQVFHAQGGAAAVSVEELKQKLGETWSSVGYASDDEAQEFRAAAEQLLERHHEASQEPGRVTLFTEKTVQRSYEGFVLFGKLDRLDRRPDGSLEIIDYKSGRRSVSEDEVRRSLAMAVYQVLVSRENPGKAVHISLWNIRTGERASALRTPEELDAVEAEIVALARAILADTQKLARPGEQCRFCAYPRVCPPGRRWLAAGAGEGPG